MSDPYPTRIHEKETVSFIGPTVNWPTKEGFIILRKAVNTLGLSDKCDELLKDDSSYKSLEPSSGRVRSVLALHKEFNPLQPTVMNIVRDLLEGQFYIHQSRVNYKHPRGSNGWHWHSDFETWHFQDGMPYPRCVSVMLAIDDNTETNGPLIVIPGSHQYWVSCKKPETHASAEENFSDQKEGVPLPSSIKYICEEEGQNPVSIKLKKGDVLIFDCNLLHMSAPNKSSKSRRNMFFVFNSSDNKLVSPFGGGNPRPTQMGERK